MPGTGPNPLWESALAALERAERIHRQFFRLAGQSRRAPVWEPPVELVEQGGRLMLMVALPGVSPDTVELTLEGDVITIRAERLLPRAFSGGTVHCLEIPYGRFERRLQLPPGPYRLRQRSTEDGCLLLVLERLE